MNAGTASRGRNHMDSDLHADGERELHIHPEMPMACVHIAIAH